MTRHHEVLGLDCEWVTIGSHQGPVSLLQLASPDGICALFRLPKLYQYDYFNNMKSIPSSLEVFKFNNFLYVCWCCFCFLMFNIDFYAIFLYASQYFAVYFLLLVSFGQIAM